MLGKLGKSWIGIAVAAALAAVAVVLMWQQMGGDPPPGVQGGQLRVCLSAGHRFLAEAKAPEATKCPECGGETVVARVFECLKGHVFVGYLEKPADPAAAQTDDEYKKHMPRMMRPGFDKTWPPGGSGQPTCPVCKTGMKRPVLDVASLKLDDIKMGALPAAGGGK